MQMIDMRRRQERVQRRVDRSGDAVVAERRRWIVIHHLVFERLAAIARLELLQLVEIEQREPCVGDRSEVAAAAFHREHPDRGAGERIGQIDLRAGVASAEVRDAQVRAEQVRAIAKEGQLVAGEPIGGAVVPEIGQVIQGCRIRHKRVRSTAESVWLRGSTRRRRAV